MLQVKCRKVFFFQNKELITVGLEICIILGISYAHIQSLATVEIIGTHSPVLHVHNNVLVTMIKISLLPSLIVQMTTNVTVLDVYLDRNSIKVINESSFKFSTSSMIEKIHLRENQLEYIHPGAFRRLKALQVLIL